MTMLLRDWCRGLLLLSALAVSVGGAWAARRAMVLHRMNSAILLMLRHPLQPPLCSVDEAPWRASSISIISHHASQHYNRRPLCRNDTALGHVKQRLFPYMPHYEAKRSEAVVLAQACKRVCSSGRSITMVSLD